MRQEINNTDRYHQYGDSKHKKNPGRLCNRPFCWNTLHISDQSVSYIISISYLLILGVGSRLHHREPSIHIRSLKLSNIVPVQCIEW